MKKGRRLGRRSAFWRTRGREIDVNEPSTYRRHVFVNRVGFLSEFNVFLIKD